ncbi:MAG TPA: hypothetical protein ENJ28_03530, partial [Gammaproteobacteria bacterium]|nr:hypothetical protein [Gammaproteobacteria bacterium]
MAKPCAKSRAEFGVRWSYLILIEPSPPVHQNSLNWWRPNQTGESSMNFYNNIHPYYCGIDLHARIL